MACLLFCAQVRQTIGKLKEKFEENLRDRDDVNAKKMERLSKQKDAGRFTLKQHKVHFLTCIIFRLDRDKAVKEAVAEAEERLRQDAEELVTTLRKEMTSLRTELETCKHMFEVRAPSFIVFLCFNVVVISGN